MTASHHTLSEMPRCADSMRPVKQFVQRPSRRLHIEFPDEEKGVFERRRDTVEAARTRGVGIGAGPRYDRINAVQPTLPALSSDARSNRGAVLERVRAI